MKRDNRINRWLFKSQVEKERSLYDKYRQMKQMYKGFYESVQVAKTLDSLLDVHKAAWSIGFQNRNLGPSSYGMFRCESIPTMTIDQVYLGDVWGLWTNTIRFWNQHADEKMYCNGFGIDPETKVYDLIMSQYRNILRRNLEAIKKQVDSYIEEYEEINPPENPFKLW